MLKLNEGAKKKEETREKTIIFTDSGTDRETMILLE